MKYGSKFSHHLVKKVYFHSFNFLYLAYFQRFILHITFSDSFLLVKKWFFFTHRFNDFMGCKDFWWIIIKLEINHLLTYMLYRNKCTNNPKWLNLSVKVILVWLPSNMFYNIKLQYWAWNMTETNFQNR